MPRQIAIHTDDVVASAGVNQVKWHRCKKIKTVWSNKDYSAFLTGLEREGISTAAIAVTTQTIAT